MPRPRRASGPSPERAAQALSILIHEGKLKAKDVAGALRRRDAMIRDLREKLVALERGASSALSNVATGRGRRWKKRISKAQRAARQAQGRYLGAIRRLSKADRAKAKTIREKSGVRAAIAEAKRMATPRTAPDGRPKRKPAARQPEGSGRRKLASKNRARTVASAAGASSRPTSKTSAQA